MDYDDTDPTFRARFLEPKFSPETIVQASASKSIGSTDLVSLKGRMNLISSETKSDLIQTIYHNHKKYIETAKQVPLLELEFYQLQTLLADEKQLLSTVKELLNSENKSETASSSSELSTSQFWETLLRHCQSLNMISYQDNRQLIYSGKFLDVKSENFFQKSTPHHSQPYYGLLFVDCFVLIKTTNIHTATAYDVDQIIKLHRSSMGSHTNRSQSISASIQIINITDEIVRNAFSIRTKFDTIILICENAQMKKHWMTMFESVLYKDSTGYLRSISHSEEEEFFAEKWIESIHEQLDILLAERNFPQAALLIIQAKTHITQFETKYSQQTFDFVDEFITNIHNKQHELYKLIEKEIQSVCEKDCITSLLKYYYQHIKILKDLGYISKACELFLNIQISLMKNTIKQTNIEEQNVVFLENLMNLFFSRLIQCYSDFVQIFRDKKSTFTQFTVWMSKELEKLINLLYNQQYITTKNFSFSIKNLQILLNKSDDFSSEVIDIRFQIHEQLEPILIPMIRSQKEHIMNTLRQRHRDEKWIPTVFLTSERLEQFFDEFSQLNFDYRNSFQPFLQTNNNTNRLHIDLAPSTLQFTKAYLKFAQDLYQIHFDLINHFIVEALIELIKLHLKYFERALKTSNEPNFKDFIMENVRFSLEYLYAHVEKLFEPKIGNEIKFFRKIHQKLTKFEQLIK